MIHALLPLLAALLLAPQDPLDHLTRLGEGRSRRASSCAADPESNYDNLRVPPGATHTLAEIAGPAVVRHIWLTFPEASPNWLAKEGGARPDEIVLRAYFDGAEAPAIEAPVGDFFACGFGVRREVRSALVMVEDGDSYNCFWPMPFFSSARFTLTNESALPLNSTYFHIDYEERPLPPDTPYFCAQYRQDFPAKHGQDYLIADIQGRGHYVGTVLSVRTRSPFWFGEGDDRFYVDGEEKPSLQGTGTEDYFLSAWGLRDNSFPYSGTVVLGGDDCQVLGARITSYRWHVLDPVRFQKSLRVEIEHKGWVPGDEKPNGEIHGHTERFDDFASVAFWYQLGQPKRFAVLPPAAERVPPSLDVVIEGERLLGRAVLAGGSASLQEGYPWTGAGQVFFQSDGQGDVSLETTFAIEKQEYRAFILALTRSYDYGIYEVQLDGETLQPALDLFADDTALEEVDCGSRSLAPGEHALRFRLTGKNPRSQGHFLGLDSVRLRERLAPR